MNPTANEILKLREQVQKRENMNITEAQKHCAASLSAGLRSWQQWERGERKMHSAFWELAKIKLEIAQIKPEKG